MWKNFNKPNTVQGKTCAIVLGNPYLKRLKALTVPFTNIFNEWIRKNPLHANPMLKFDKY